MRRPVSVAIFVGLAQVGLLAGLTEETTREDGINGSREVRVFRRDGEEVLRRTVVRPSAGQAVSRLEEQTIYLGGAPLVTFTKDDMGMTSIESFGQTGAKWCLIRYKPLDYTFIEVTGSDGKVAAVYVMMSSGLAPISDADLHRHASERAKSDEVWASIRNSKSEEGVMDGLRRLGALIEEQNE